MRRQATDWHPKNSTLREQMPHQRMKADIKEPHEKMASVIWGSPQRTADWNLSYLYTFTRIIKIRNTDTTKCWCGCAGCVDDKNFPYISGGNAKGHRHFETVWQFLTKLSMVFMQSSNYMHDIYPNELKIYIPRKACTWMLIAAFFVVAKTWKQPILTSEWINKL